MYAPGVEMSNGKPVCVPLRISREAMGNKRISADDWKLDISELRKSINKCTKAIMLNTPNNPLGKIFTRQELEEIAAVVREHDHLIVISDEVVCPQLPVSCSLTRES